MSNYKGNVYRSLWLKCIFVPERVHVCVCVSVIKERSSFLKGSIVYPLSQSRWRGHGNWRWKPRRFNTRGFVMPLVITGFHQERNGNKRPFVFSHQNRHSWLKVDRLAQICGAVRWVFFSSGWLGSCVECWRSRGLWTRQARPYWLDGGERIYGKMLQLLITEWGQRWTKCHREIFNKTTH